MFAVSLWGNTTYTPENDLALWVNGSQFFTHAYLACASSKISIDDFGEQSMVQTRQQQYNNCFFLGISEE